MSEGQNVKGFVTCAPNSRNNRDLDIAFEYEVEPEAGAAIGEKQKAVVQYKMCVTIGIIYMQADLSLGLDAWCNFRSFVLHDAIRKISHI